MINSVGVETFIKYYYEFSKLNKEKVTKAQLSKLFVSNNEKWRVSTITTKINSGLKIFTENREIEAINHILDVKKTGNIPNGINVKKQAKKIRQSFYESELLNSSETIYPTESDSNYEEGKTKTVYVNIYERNSVARQKCIEHYGLSCQICHFNFEKKFGDLGKDFIHVHHKIDIASIGIEYSLNPITDLIPVCPNCHSMLHKRKPAYSIKKLKKLVKKQKANR